MADWWEEETEAAPAGDWWEETPPTASQAPPGETPPPPQPGMKEVAPGVWAQMARLPIPGMGSMRDVAGAAEVLGSVASSAVAEPVAGYAGLAGAAIPGEPGQGAEMVQGARQAMTYQPRTEAGQELLGEIGSFLTPMGEALGAVESGLGEAVLDVTGSEALATAAHTLPTAMMELLGLGILRRPSKAALNAAKAQQRIKIKPNATPDEIARELMEPEARSYQQITEDLRAGLDERLAEDVMPDHQIIAAAEELGVDLNPSAYSTNEAFVRVEQAVKSRPDSKLAAREAEAITKLGERADELIRDMGGEIDKALLDERVRGRLDSTIKDLGKQTEAAYKTINDKIPVATKVNAKASQAYIQQRMMELGDNASLLTTAERKLHAMMTAKRPPTYGALDTLRRDIGDAYKRKGPFKDDATGTLDQVYGALIRDQEGVASAFNMGAEFAGARKLVQTRKDIEAQATKLYGNQLGGSIIPKIALAATSLTKGDVSRFRTIMESVPANMRSTTAATMLNDLFTLGAKQKGSIGAGFANAYEGLARNAGAKAELFKHLPPEAGRRFDAIGKVSQGIYRARALENTSKTARDILHALESGSGVSRLMDKTSDTVLGRMTFMPGPTRWAASLAKASKDAAKAAFNKAKAADELMASDAFSRAINKAMEGKVKQAETMLKSSRVWQAWRNTLGEGTKAQLASMGPIAWFTQQEQAPAPPPQPEVTQPEPGSEGLPSPSPPAEAIQGALGVQ